MTYTPLVSIVVITYNSAKYILETLDSIKEQNYKNLELIISDDYSTDSTTQICEEWLKINKKRFVKTHLVTSPINTGIPANCNRGYRLAQGEWIKGIAGDDLLLKDCIKNLIEHSKHTNILCGRIIPFYEENSKKIINWNNQLPSNFDMLFFKLSPEKQYQYLLTKSFNFAPGVMIKKELFCKIGDFNEKYFYIEDLPYWLRCTTNNIKINMIDIPVVLYRLGYDSVSNSKKYIFNLKFENCIEQFKVNDVYPHIKWYKILFWQDYIINKTVYYIAVYIFKNKRSFISNIFISLFINISFKNIFKKLRIKSIPKNI